ncbi:hypothetical protein SH591_13050 [Sphingomonas sp. LY54]|uniref:DUF6894 family protein n=1 Tax=Sphingomonadales TaxID=204457 RepID=UPI002ADEE9A3|nr:MULTISPECIES: hypothetical protein [Sphingomonadales]MEA1015663.1 hypothetical protein [Sphingosinicella sp. LY1275]WRP28022.1 hypothetical protein SH591_13050 [Sphingomonas sp. LY54]
MPRFYFHIRSDDVEILDDEGSEFPDLDAAWREAIDGARGILSQEVLKGSLPLHERIDIADEAGGVLRTVPFTDVVEIGVSPEDE